LVSSASGDAEEARKIAEQEKSDLAEWLSSRMGLTLSPEKTLVTPVTHTMRFLGHHLRVRQHPRKRTLVPRLVIPKDRSQRLRYTIKQILGRRTTSQTLGQQLKQLNPVVRGWHKPRRAALHWRDNGVVPASLAPLRAQYYRLAAERGPTYA
jgi:hypothetical protein